MIRFSDFTEQSKLTSSFATETIHAADSEGRMPDIHYLEKER